MFLSHQPGARPVKYAPAGPQINYQRIGEKVKIQKDAAIIIIALFGDASEMKVGRIMVKACAFPQTAPQTETTSGTTDCKFLLYLRRLTTLNNKVQTYKMRRSKLA